MEFLLTKNNRPNLISLIGKLDDQQLYEVTIKEHGVKRSHAQNKRYWELLGEIGKYLGYNSDEMHQLMSYKFLSEATEIMDTKITVIPSTTSLGVKEFKDYMERIENFAAGFGFVFNSKILHDFQDFQDG